MSDNPYQPTEFIQEPTPGGGHMPSANERALVTAIVKDANQYAIAMLLSIFCSLLGCLIIGPWYFIRLRQWTQLSRSQPFLIDPNVEHGSLADQFQKARQKLITGIAFGCVMTVIWVCIFAYRIKQGV
ncbi:MAG: hypothetical protein AAF483_22805 [Planctomycetota bacterium]